MQIQLINVAQKLPAWADLACDDFVKRLLRELTPKLVTLPLAARKAKQSTHKLQQVESALIMDRLRPGSLNLALDEGGEQWSSIDWSRNLQRWMFEFPRVNLIIGGGRRTLSAMPRILPSSGCDGPHDNAACPRKSGVAGATVSRLDYTPGPSLPPRIGDRDQLTGYYATMIYLASNSPRRAELLDQIGVKFRVHALEIDESRITGEAPAEYVCRMATEKAQLAARQLVPQQPDYRVLAADTAIALDGDIIGKPADRNQCRRILGRLSARQHLVLTAVALATPGGIASRLVQSRVSFRALSAAEIESYCAAEEPMDKAGAYAIQGRAAVFITHLEGSYSAVMGLPLYETAELLQSAETALEH